MFQKVINAISRQNYIFRSNYISIPLLREALSQIKKRARALLVLQNNFKIRLQTTEWGNHLGAFVSPVSLLFIKQELTVGHFQIRNQFFMILSTE